jgi:hypothetical protein
LRGLFRIRMSPQILGTEVYPFVDLLGKFH